MSEDFFQTLKTRSEIKTNPVTASIQRIHDATSGLSLGMHSSWFLEPRRQELGNTCFFSGAIQVAQANGRQVSEQELATEANARGLLNAGGAVTYDPAKARELERFVYEHTDVRIRQGFPKMPPGNPQFVDLRLLRGIVNDGNLILLQYPLSSGRGEWVTIYGVEKRSHEEDPLFHMTFSGRGPNGVIETLTTPKMAQRLYGVKGALPEIWAIEVQTHYPNESKVDSDANLFTPVPLPGDEIFTSIEK